MLIQCYAPVSFQKTLASLKCFKHCGQELREWVLDFRQQGGFAPITSAGSSLPLDPFFKFETEFLQDKILELARTKKPSKYFDQERVKQIAQEH